MKMNNVCDICTFNEIGCIQSGYVCDAVSNAYQQGKVDAFNEIAYSDNVCKENFEKIAHQQGREDAIYECKEILRSAITEDGKTKCFVYLKALNEMEQIKEQKNE